MLFVFVMVDNRRLTNAERATALYVRDKIVKPLSKRGNVVNPEFRGASLLMQTSTDKYTAVSGVARSGKSFAILYRLNQLALQHPGMRGLIVRKTRESLNESALVTFERDVLGEGNPIVPGGQRNSRHSYRYPNGSEIIVRGLLASGKDASSQVMSSEYDIIYVQEATEIREQEFGQLTTRLSNHRVPFQAIWLDCNPEAPSHWIWRYHLGEKIKLHHSYLKDNPKWWIIDPSLPEGGRWTEQGLDVYTTLSNLNGIQRDRLFEGKWVQATGLVYGDVWDDGSEDGNVTEAADYIEDGGEVYWFVDDGYAGEYDKLIDNFTPNSHPRVFLLAQVRSDGTVCVFEESVKIQTQPEIHINEVSKMGYEKSDGTFQLYPEPYRIVVDKAAVDLIGRLGDIYGHGNVSNQKIVNVEEGIKALRSYIGKDQNGKRKLLVHPRCKNFRFEMTSYKRDDKGIPVSEYDHSPSCARYGISVVGSFVRPNFRTLG